ncbi:N-acetylglucosamine-specific PTS transporter subunit IIBC [Paenibacillus pini]|uniref:PTS system n=1 Tax=Paenibacillus pini JCM 16418 TaxID=1236976 RepID=W7YH67_9BACL|nr:N-acetylglucosamine-specific PTS transporter subunit IIBC [Paenibacillus pini]GAF07797.1 PTS system [Paenibacillus pini JCM 16418]
MLAFLQKIGKSLMLPVATLPAASILMRFGQIDYIKDFHLGNQVGWFLNHYIAPFLNAGGTTIFDNLPMIFAVGVAIGLTGDAVAALSAVIGYLILSKVLVVVPTTFTTIMGKDVKLDMGVLGGIIVGLIAAYLYNRFHKIKLPDWLGFFAGKRFVPIITSVTMVVVGIILGLIWGPVQDVLDTFGNWIVGLGGFGAAVYMIANRLLLPFGLHHILNSIVWFQIGDFTNAAGQVIHGDLNRFFQGDKSAGMFMSGFFPVMMFALPAAALAIIHTAKKEKRKVVASIFISAGVASFLTGITEPLEFAFMFVAPVLYGIHAILAGVSGYIMYALGIKLGFGFSAGLIDYLLGFKISTKPLLLIPVGLIFAVVYYALFRFVIVKFNMKTPGREDDVETEGEVVTEPGNANAGYSANDSKAAKVLANIGGSDNIESIDACITRLRLVVKDDKVVNDQALKQLGASGVMRLGKGAVQIVFGPQSEILKDEIKTIM